MAIGEKNDFVGVEFFDSVSVLIRTALILTIRILATVFKWNLPQAIDFSKNEDDK